MPADVPRVGLYIIVRILAVKNPYLNLVYRNKPVPLQKPHVQGDGSTPEELPSINGNHVQAIQSLSQHESSNRTPPKRLAHSENDSTVDYQVARNKQERCEAVTPRIFIFELIFLLNPIKA